MAVVGGGLLFFRPLKAADCIESRCRMMMVFSQVLQSYRKEGRSKALFIIRYEGHVDLVTAHKPHFEIVETLLRYVVLLS